MDMQQAMLRQQQQQQLQQQAAAATTAANRPPLAPRRSKSADGRPASADAAGAGRGGAPSHTSANGTQWELNSDDGFSEGFVVGSASMQPPTSPRSNIPAAAAAAAAVGGARLSALPRRTTEEYVHDLPEAEARGGTTTTTAAATSTGAAGGGSAGSRALREQEDTRKISDILLHAKATGQATVSFEFFPATTVEDNESLLQQIERVGYELRPAFVSLTWSVAFKDKSRWMDLGEAVQKRFGISVLMHLTCHQSRDDIAKTLDLLRARGLRNVLALRGDLPANARGSGNEGAHGATAWTALYPKQAGFFSHAGELVRFIRERHGTYFCIAVGGYPETHPGCWNNPHLPPSEQARAQDLRYLKEKVDAGADFIISQFVFDPGRFLRWRQACRGIGISEPIVAGYLPLQRYSVFEKFTSWCRAAVPGKMKQELELVRSEPKAVRTYGVKMAVAHLRTLLLGASGAGLGSGGAGAGKGPVLHAPCYNIHLYTVNEVGPQITKVLRKLDLVPLNAGHTQRPRYHGQWDSCYNCNSSGPGGGGIPGPKSPRLSSASGAGGVSGRDPGRRAEVGARGCGEQQQDLQGWSSVGRGGGSSAGTGVGSSGQHSRASSGSPPSEEANRGGGGTGGTSTPAAGSDMVGAAAGGAGVDPHEVRPIFWDNRQSSYLQRTRSWEQFPNGRWGTLSQEASFGTLSEDHLSSQKDVAALRKMWGTPRTEEEVAKVFARFLEGKIRSIPWISAADVAPETNRMRHDLLRINRHGFLSINSQPAVNGARSSDPDVGWGPPDAHGYVFQKAYIEFFTSPFLFQKLLKALPRHPSLSYHAINARGEEYNNYDDHNSVNAVTWGVFPDKEIVQPTIVDASSFRVWKDEAFDLWIKQWASIYEPEGDTKDSYNLIKRIHDTYLLVNIVDNDYTNEDSDVFAIFSHIINSLMSDAERLRYIQDIEQENRRLVRENRRLRTTSDKLESRVDALLLEEKLMRAEIQYLR